MTDRASVETAIVDTYRREWAFVLAAAVRVCRDLDLAEECVQEAYATALESWARDGIPANPAAWLTLIAKRRAMDAVRRDRTWRAKLPLLVVPDDDPTQPAHDDEIADDRLRLVFTCCHPALPSDGQVALTLRLVCGVTTPEIARAFLVSEPTMAARITRAKKKIAGARIPYRVPQAAELLDRLRAVLGVVHLLFTTGHTAPTGSMLVRDDLVERALHLARMLHELLPDEPEVRGLLGLLLVTDARRMTRLDAHGRLLRLEEQDRASWDWAAIAEADELIVGALERRPGRYALQAAIAALYTQAPSFEETDWPQAVQLYDRLLDLWPSPVVALNRTVPLSYATGPAAALAEVAALEQDQRLAGYPYLPAIKADLLVRLDRHQEAATVFRHAIELTANDTERAFLSSRLRHVANELSL